MNFSFRFYFSLLMRRLPVMMALVLICSGLGIATALQLPSTYDSTATLSVESAQINLESLDSATRTSANEQLSLIQQRLLTRSNLLDIANKYQVIENMSEMNPDQVYLSMIGNTNISRTTGFNEATTMTLSFTARDGQIAANVVNEYVTIILEANTDFRISRAEDTLSFFEGEVARLDADLSAQSARIVEFKEANKGALPDDLDYRLGRQSLLQERLARLESERALVENQRQETVSLFERTGRIRTLDPIQLSPEEIELERLQGQLAQLRSVLSESNPRVTLLARQVEQLEERIADQAAIARANGSEEEEEAAPSQLDISLAQIDVRLERIGEEIAVAQAGLAELERSITATSANAIVLAALERDYDNIQLEYNDAVQRRNDASSRVRIEASSQGQRVTLVESANVPQLPSGPRRKLIAAMGVGVGVGLAAAFFILLELLNFSIRRPAELESRFGIRPMATIPYIESPRHRRRRRFLLAVASLAVIVGVPAGLWYVNENVMPLQDLAAQILERVGL